MNYYYYFILFYSGTPPVGPSGQAPKQAIIPSPRANKKRTFVQGQSLPESAQLCEWGTWSQLNVLNMLPSVKLMYLAYTCSNCMNRRKILMWRKETRCIARFSPPSIELHSNFRRWKLCWHPKSLGAPKVQMVNIFKIIIFKIRFWECWFWVLSSFKVTSYLRNMNNIHWRDFSNLIFLPFPNILW